VSIQLLTATFIHVHEDRIRDGSGMISEKRPRREETVTVKKSLFLRVQVSNFVILHRVHFISHRCWLGLFCYFFLLISFLSLLSLMSQSFVFSWVSSKYIHISVLCLTPGSPLATTASLATKYICYVSVLGFISIEGLHHKSVKLKILLVRLVSWLRD